MIGKYLYEKSVKPFTILAHNCLGGGVYAKMGVQYTTPIAGLFILPKHYVKFRKNLDHYLAIDHIEIKYYNSLLEKETSYPIGVLDDIELHFLHAQDAQQAVNDWNRRKKRIVWENLYVVMTDTDGFDKDIIEEFLSLPFKNKKLIGCRPYNHPDYIEIKHLSKNNSVGDLYTNRLDLMSYFDLWRWVGGKKQSRSKIIFCKLLRKSKSLYTKLRAFVKQLMRR